MSGDKKKQHTRHFSCNVFGGFMNLTRKYIQVLNGNTIPITTFVNRFVYPWLQDNMGASHCWVQRKTQLNGIHWQWGHRAGSTQKGWIICCHSFSQSNCVMDSKQTSKGPQLCPCAGSHLGTGLSLLQGLCFQFLLWDKSLCTEPPKDPFQALKMTVLFLGLLGFFVLFVSCSSVCYLPQVVSCRQGYGAQETIFLLSKTKKMHNNSSSSGQREWDHMPPCAPCSFYLPLPMGNKTPIFGGTLKLWWASD